MVAATAIGACQMGRWQLGNPSLILDLPGDPRGGGVAWHTGGLGLPTSWSSENADLRVEVAEIYGGFTVENLQAKIGGTASGTRPISISGYAGSQFTLAEKQCLLLPTPGRTWAIVASPKTSQGQALAGEVFGSIAVERSGEKRWVQRSLGRTKMNAELPFELAADTERASANRAVYELHFDDFVVNASVSSAEEGKRVDFEGTIKSTIEDEKRRSTEFSSKRTKLKREQLDAELLEIEMTRGRKYKLSIVFVNDSGRLLRLTLTSRAESANHGDYTRRILDSLRVSSVSFEGFEPRPVGDEGVWFDLPKPFEKLDASNYNSFPGSFQINVRVTPVDPGTGSNPDQLLDFLDIKFKATKDARDYKSERSQTLVNGMEARILKAGYKGKGRSDQTMLYAMAIFLPDRIVVAEMISEEQQKAYLDRIVDTARIELKAPSGWTRQRAGESGLSIVAQKFEAVRVKGSGNEGDRLDIDINAEGLLASISELSYTASPPAPAILARQLFGIVRDAAKATGSITSQQPIEIGNHSGIRASMELEVGQGKVTGDIIVLKRGNTYWALVVAANPSNGSAMIKRAVLINSIQ